MTVSLIWAAKEAGVEWSRPSEFGVIYESQQSWRTTRFTAPVAGQKALIRR